MRLYSECMPCFLKRVRYEIFLSTDDDKLARKILRECSREIARQKDLDCNSAELSTRIHKIAYRMLGDSDPYREIKKTSDSVAKTLYRRAERFVHSSRDPLRAAAMVAIAGNVFDYGITSFKDPKMMFKIFNELCRTPLGHDDLGKIKKLIGPGKHVVFFTDNCGEVVFDRLLIESIKRTGSRVTLVAKGVPILSDATVKDVCILGLDKLVDRVVGTESFAVGVDIERASKTFLKMLKEADLILCKGMANYEIFSDYHEKFGPIAYLMRTKCHPVADSAGVPYDKSVILLADAQTGKKARKKA